MHDVILLMHVLKFRRQIDCLVFSEDFISTQLTVHVVVTGVLVAFMKFSEN